MTHYEALGVVLQQLWIIGMWALLIAARVSRRTRSLAIVAALVSDVAITNGFFVWPKLLGRRVRARGAGASSSRPASRPCVAGR